MPSRRKSSRDVKRRLKCEERCMPGRFNNLYSCVRSYIKDLGPRPSEHGALEPTAGRKKEISPAYDSERRRDMKVISWSEAGRAGGYNQYNCSSGPYVVSPLISGGPLRHTDV